MALGTSRVPGPGQQGDPASIWMLPELREVAQATRVITVALHQRQFEADYSKPTRLAGSLRDGP